jgi:hypothetical protein
MLEVAIVNVGTFDSVLYFAQLNRLQIVSTALLVDESQDLTACQIDWFSQQQDHGTQLFFVGDAAQSIYSFRGARSKLLIMLGKKRVGLNVTTDPDRPIVDLELTKSFRFGANIAAAANTILFAKHKSTQTATRSNREKHWRPYRLVGGAQEPDGEPMDGLIVSESSETRAFGMCGDLIRNKQRPLQLQGAQGIEGEHKEETKSSTVDVVCDATTTTFAPGSVALLAWQNTELCK